MCVSEQDIAKAIEALNKRPPLAKGRMPEVLDRVYDAIVGIRDARQAKWDAELMAYCYRDLGLALEMWRIAREEVEEGAGERLVPDDKESQR